ncbi:MAG: preprotein translocase subunit SecD [Patescibacteria group bacterium]|nr:preprotein translocase subunit SecD [Patescibacteria group bacterium]
MTALRDTIERRVNVFGVSEPIVQTETTGVFGTTGTENRLIVDLPGVTNVEAAKSAIGATPVLEFFLIKSNDYNAITAKHLNATDTEMALDAIKIPTGITGGLLSRAVVTSDQTTGSYAISLQFNSAGTALFASTTKNNIGSILAIYLDGHPLELPTIREAIPNGQAQITGNFTLTQANELVRNLNFGALPVPITILSEQTIGPTLGAATINAGIMSGIIAFIVIAIFLIVWYRLPGLLAVIALACYVALNLFVFKVGISPTFFYLVIIFMILAVVVHWSFGIAIPVFYGLLALIPGALSPVVLTSAGIAGFILSVGMAVDANILIFERLKEELKKGKSISEAVQEGFARAWPSIRDSNTSSIITGVILYLFSSTSVVTGFALVFIVGVFISMFTAITASRMLLLAVSPKKTGRFALFLMKNGFTR